MTADMSHRFSLSFAAPDRERRPTITAALLLARDADRRRQRWQHLIRHLYGPLPPWGGIERSRENVLR